MSGGNAAAGLRLLMPLAEADAPLPFQQEAERNCARKLGHFRRFAAAVECQNA